MNTLLHAHGSEYSNIWIGLLKEVFLHSLLESLKIIPFLFLTYLLMEIIEHKASDKTRLFIQKAGASGPFIGGLLGAVPQCGFSASIANLYTARVVTLGTLVAVFLSTSDEMLPILLSGKVGIKAIFFIVGYKILVGIIAGFAIDLIIRLTGHRREAINIDEICENDDCHCERGVFFSTLHHTLTIGLFILVTTVLLNALYFFVGEETLSSITYDKPFISHAVAALLGLIPNCAVSVAFSTLYIENSITVGTMLSGLFSGAGIGLLLLFKVNRRLKENLLIVAILFILGTLFGLLADLFNFSSLLQ